MKWMKLFSEHWSRAARLGAGPIDSLLHKRIVLTNYFGLTLMIIALVCALMWLLEGEITGVIFNLVFFGFFSLTLLWNKKGYYFLSRFWILGSINLGMFLSVGSVGRYADSQTVFYILGGLPFLFFEPREKKSLISSIAIPIILYSILFAYDFKLFGSVLMTGENNPLPVVTYLGCFFLVISCMYYLYRETEKAEKKLKDANYELLSNQIYLKSVIENIPLIFYTKGADNRYTLVNSEFEKLFKVKQNEVLSKESKDVFTSSISNFLDFDDSEVLNTKKSKTFESFLDSDFEKTFLCTKFPIRGPLGESFGICGISLDISERIAAQKALDEQRALVLQNMKLSAIGEMANGMSHEINNPLATMTLLVSKLQRLTKSDKIEPEILKNSLFKFQDSIHRITKIVAALRKFIGDYEVEQKVQVYLEDMINDTLALCQEKFKLKGGDLQIEISGTPYPVLCQSAGIHQVIYNLLTNAFDAVEGQNHPWVKLKTEYLSGKVKITVSDSGPGIPYSTREKIFQPFFTTKEVGKGQGLGLSIAKGIMTSHRGKLYLNIAQMNTSFVLELPRES